MELVTKLQKSVSFWFNSEEDIWSYPVSIPDSDFSHIVDEMIKVLRQQRKFVSRELTGKFSLNEAQLICEATKDIMYAGEMSARIVLMHAIEDASDFYNVDLKWQIDRSEIVQKVKELTEFQAYVVISMAFEYRAIREEDKTEDILKKIFMI